jgi:hypothetical protein
MQLFLALLIIIIIGFISYILTVLCQTTFLYLYDAGRNVYNIVVLGNTSTGSDNNKNQKTTKVVSDKVGGHKVLIGANPGQNALQIEIQGQEQDVETTLYLYNHSGKLLKTKKPAESNFSLDLSTYDIGTYLLKIVLDNKVSDWKIIKE